MVDWVGPLILGFGLGLLCRSVALCLCVEHPATDPGAHPRFEVWVPSPLILVWASQASGESWGCSSCVHSPGAEGGGAPEARAAAESSLTSRKCLYFLFEKFFLFKPPWSKPAPGLSHSPAWLFPKNPGTDPVPGPGASAALVPALVPGTLLSLSTLLTVSSFNVLYL